MNKGEVVSIIGSSGNGKTTLLRCLNFLEIPDSGSITVDGNVIFPLNGQVSADADDKVSADADNKTTTKVQNPCTFGLVFQNFNLFPQYNALRNISLAMDLRDERTLKAQKLKRGERKQRLKELRAKNEEVARTLLARVGLAEKANNYPCELSGGQKQRVAIARALALSPDILCFDEPTSALDPELTGEVLKVIKGLIDEDRTIIIVTHEMDFAKNVSDKIIFMADGVIEEIGSPDEVINNPKSEKTKAFFRSDTL